MKIGKVISQLCIRIPLILWAIIVIYPIVWMFLGSFKSNAEIYASPWTWPEVFNIDNFILAWTEYNIGSGFINSAIVTILGTALCLAFAIPTSYALERVRFKGSQFLFNVYLASMMIPAVLGWIPLFFLLMKMNMLDNLWALSLVYAISHVPFTIFILTSFMGNVPKELEEAAAIDGMSPYGVLLKVVTPLVKSGIITASILNAISFWNEYFMALILLQSEKKNTLGVAMDLLNQNAEYNSAWGALFAGLSIAVIPIIIIYALFQRHIVKGMTEGAVKG
ncbi:carbohydrate ABC transporter membrane protein 2 (CUT1 family) [Pseudogracilibacillus auburnensis]|uniref:Carbohydrate ABC transporter membrane protein 2 (CUT1 family) n=1 Tax=Pseudogracilibacillus auburnensis TaxID=1494959 RepID=A0A2V3VX98_9BACI|nr:carbohydrate ABC transporter permease [Pseudogracilibacillus auburnensis]MBO1004657.1 carbohydrate ABC transporter permease [Pseudogracilibacillus auburnensis]PXW85564.1 carbohydrate ABC transporter membrane protein 2 (CUT1 family) [Pseudogracilibacillus auburnensis]